MKAWLFVFGCLVVGVALMILPRIKVERFNRREKKIFRDAMKNIDNSRK